MLPSSIRCVGDVSLRWYGFLVVVCVRFTLRLRSIHHRILILDLGVLETLFKELVFLVSSVLRWEIRVVRWIRRRETVWKNVSFRNSEIGRSSSFLEVASVCVPWLFRVPLARGACGVALAPWCGSRGGPVLLGLQFARWRALGSVPLWTFASLCVQRGVGLAGPWCCSPPPARQV